jgi:hypothetical protein
MGVRGPQGENYPVQMTLSCVGATTPAPLNVFEYFTPSNSLTPQQADCFGEASVAATSPYDLLLLRDSDNVVMVTVSWGAGDTVPTITVNQLTLVRGVRYRWEGPPASDPTLQDFNITISAIRS